MKVGVKERMNELITEREREREREREKCRVEMD